MLLKNICAVLPLDLFRGDLRMENGVISEIQPCLAPLPNEEVLDGNGAYLLAGFIDSHTHGAVGQLYSDPKCDIAAVTAYEARVGVTTVAATFHTMPTDMVADCADNVEKYLAENHPGHARIGGIHMEGPFINAVKKGAMNPDYILPPTEDEFDRLYDACRGRMKIMTIAPEMPGALDVIKRGAARGVKMSAGHTDAAYEEMKAGIDAGITRMTHTFNACRALSHREPGVLGAAMNDDRVTCEVICDFGHLHPTAVGLLYRVKGADGFCAISDSEFGAGLPEGSENIIDGRHTVVRGGLAYLDNGTICGSASPLFAAYTDLRSLDVPILDISVMLSYNPAVALGIADKTGSIELGKAADLVLIDKEDHIRAVFVDGVRVDGTL